MEALKAVVANVADRLADEIISRRTAELEKKGGRWPRRNPILSDISECNRQIAYGVTDWDKREAVSVDLQARFEAGNQQERQIVSELLAMGFNVVLAQMPVEVKGRNGRILATGRIDGKIVFDGVSVPIEIKSMNPNIYNQIKTLDDFKKKPWLRKYLRQMQMYLFGNNQEQGVFILTDCLGHWMILPIYLDYGECELILQRLEKVSEHLASGTLPDRITYDSSICGKCQFMTICLQDIINTPAEMINDEAVIQEVARHEELDPLASEYDKIHKKLKGSFGKLEKVFIGDQFLIQNVPSERTVYELDEKAEAAVAAIKSQFAKKVPQKRMVILKLDKK